MVLPSPDWVKNLPAPLADYMRKRAILAELDIEHLRNLYKEVETITEQRSLDRQYKEACLDWSSSMRQPIPGQVDITRLLAVFQEHLDNHQGYESNVRLHVSTWLQLAVETRLELKHDKLMLELNGRSLRVRASKEIEIDEVVIRPDWTSAYETRYLPPVSFTKIPGAAETYINCRENHMDPTQATLVTTDTLFTPQPEWLRYWFTEEKKQNWQELEQAFGTGCVRMLQDYDIFEKNFKNLPTSDVPLKLAVLEVETLREHAMDFTKSLATWAQMLLPPEPVEFDTKQALDILEEYASSDPGDLRVAYCGPSTYLNLARSDLVKPYAPQVLAIDYRGGTLLLALSNRNRETDEVVVSIDVFTEPHIYLPPAGSDEQQTLAYQYAREQGMGVRHAANCAKFSTRQVRSRGTGKGPTEDGGVTATH